MFPINFLLRWPGWWILTSTDWFLITNLSWDEELLHGHVMHGGEVHGNILMAVVHVTGTEVLLEVDHILSHHDWIL